MLGGERKYPIDEGVSYINLGHGLVAGDTVVAYWEMIANNDTYKYKYR